MRVLSKRNYVPILRLRRIALLSLLTIVAAVGLFAQAPTHAARPVNDERANALDLGRENLVVLEGTTLGATAEPGEPGDTNIAGAVWFKWTPTVTGGVYYRLEEGSTLIYAFGTNGMPVSRGNESFYAIQNTTYEFAVYPRVQPGPFRVSISIGPLPNDAFADAIEVTPRDGLLLVNGALWELPTKEPGEPEVYGFPGTIWYRWVPDFSGRIEYGLNPNQQSDPMPLFNVYRSTGPGVSDLVLVSGPNDRPSVVAGNTYYFSVYAATQPFEMTIEKAPSPPANDSFRDALPMTMVDDRVSVSGTTLGATREEFEPYNDLGLNSVWYKWEPEVSRRMLVHSPLADVTVFEQQGDEIQSLVQIGKGGQGILFRTGTRYLFAAYNRGARSQEFVLSLLPSLTSAQGSDSFFGAPPLEFRSGGTLTITGNLQNATLETGEPAPAGSIGSVWYAIRVPFAAYLTARRSDPRVAFRVFSGTSLNNLEQMKPALLYPGIDYYIALHAINEVETFSVELNRRNWFFQNFCCL